MSYFSKRALRWAAPVALVGALGLAACGGNDDTEAVRVAAPGVVGVGSDQHLNNKAEELASASASAGSDQHLNNTAEEIAQQQRAYQAASARLSGQAEQYKLSVESGNLAAQMSQAESYAQQQQDRADSNSSGDDSYGDDFLPGSRHVPTR